MDRFLGRNLPGGEVQMASENFGKSPSSQELMVYAPS